MTDDQRSNRRRRMILVCVVLGLAIAGAEGYGGDTKAAIFTLVLYAAIGAWFLFSKSDFLDTVLQLDERQKHVVGKARELTSVIMAWILVGWAISNCAHGNFTGAVTTLCAVMGSVFLGTVIFFHFRS